MKMLSLQKISLLLCIGFISLSCTHSGYEDAIDNGNWRILENFEREGWYLKVNNNIYGCDEINIECCIKYNEPLQDIDVESFLIAENCDYSKDKTHVYYPLLIRCADLLGESSEDCNDYCYFIEYIIDGADPKTFKYLGDGYAVDRRHMYDEGREIPWDNEIIKRYQKQTVPNDSKP